MIDANYFRHSIISFVTEYAEHRGLRADPDDLQVSLKFADGDGIDFVAWRAGDQWITFFTEGDEMLTVPYETITRVAVRPGPEPHPQLPRTPVGFAAVDTPQPE